MTCSIEYAAPPDVRSTLPIGVLGLLQAVLAQSLFCACALMFICALIGLSFMFLLPGGKAEQYCYKEDSPETALPALAKYEPDLQQSAKLQWLYNSFLIT